MKRFSCDNNIPTPQLEIPGSGTSKREGTLNFAPFGMALSMSFFWSCWVLQVVIFLKKKRKEPTNHPIEQGKKGQTGCLGLI